MLNHDKILQGLQEEWDAKIPPTPTTQLLINQLYTQAGLTNAQGVKNILSCLVKLQHLGQAKTPADIQKAVLSFDK